MALCLQMGSAPFVRRRCDCLASSAPFTNIQTYLLTYTLTKAQTQELESIQKRAIHIISHFTRGMRYSCMLAATNLTSLSSRKDDLSRNLFLSITNPTSCLHHLFPHPDLMQLHLGLVHTKFTQDRLPVQSDTVPSNNISPLC